MRRTLCASALLAAILVAGGPARATCDCFSPAQKIQAAQDALAKARLALFVRVVDVAADGQARLLVLESFKGPAPGAVLQAQAGLSNCKARFEPHAEVLLLAFTAATTACDALPADNFLLEGLRALPAK